MATPVYGNNGFKKTVNITVDASQTVKPVRALMGMNQLVNLGTTDGTIIFGGIASTTLTASQINQAAKNPMGLQLGGATVAWVGGNYTTPTAASLQSVLGLTSIGAGKFLRFFWLDVPSADAVFVAGSGVTINTLGSAGLIICKSGGLASSVTYNQAEVYVSALVVTAGSETCLMTITKQGGSLPA
jgi:hypothetical protein